MKDLFYIFLIVVILVSFYTAWDHENNRTSPRYNVIEEINYKVSCFSSHHDSTIPTGIWCEANKGYYIQSTWLNSTAIYLPNASCYFQDEVMGRPEIMWWVSESNINWSVDWSYATSKKFRMDFVAENNGSCTVFTSRPDLEPGYHDWKNVPVTNY